MNQKEFLKAIVAEAKEREIELSQAIVKELLEVIETAIDNAVLEGKTVKVFNAVKVIRRCLIFLIIHLPFFNGL